ITFSGPAIWTPGTMVNLDVFLTFSGYNATGLSYWLEVPNTLAPYIAITNVQYFTFPNPNQLTPNPAAFNSPVGASSGYMLETRDVGATDNPPAFTVPGTYHISTITFALGNQAPNGIYTMLTTSHSPRISAVTDTDGNSNVIPPAMFVINRVPEASTLGLLSFAVVGWGVLIYRRRNR